VCSSGGCARIGLTALFTVGNWISCNLAPHGLPWAENWSVDGWIKGPSGGDTAVPLAWGNYGATSGVAVTLTNSRRRGRRTVGRRAEATSTTTTTIATMGTTAAATTTAPMTITMITTATMAATTTPSTDTTTATHDYRHDHHDDHDDGHGGHY
jgi:hypothetical protein